MTKDELDKAHRAAVAKAKGETLDRIVSMHMAGLPPFQTEHQFHPTRRWRLDYVWPDALVALEVHGGVFDGGRHTRGKGFTGDREKMNEAACLGWLVIEVTSDQLKQGKARDWVERAISTRRSRVY